MLFGPLALLLALLIVCSFTPGFFFLRRLSWTPLEKLAGSVGLSLILIYLAAWTSYCFGPHDQRYVFSAVAAGAVLLGILARGDIRRLSCSFRVHQAVAGFAFLLAWTLAMLAVIRVYSGAGWSGDWYEHFQRSLFFLQRFPTHVTIFPNYALPARPPMMNVLAAFFLGLTGDRFALFQVTFAFLNVLLFLPCLLLLPALGASRKRHVVPLLAILAANPVVMENATYTWTKSLTVFFVLLALALYLAGWRKRDSVRTVAAFVALATGLLVHYSAGPYIAFLTLHYAVRWYRERPRRWRELYSIAAICGLLLATWFAWSAKVYGVRGTLASNTSVTSTRQYQGSNLEKMAGNLWDSVVPAWIRGESQPWPQQNPDGELRDDAFLFYQTNLVFAMGGLGGLVVLWLLLHGFARGRTRRETLFWGLLTPSCILLGIAVVGERDLNGVPHLTLITMEVLGLTLLAAHFRGFPRWVKFLVIAGCCVDFYFGVFLQAHIESLENTPGHVAFAAPMYTAGQFVSPDSGPDSLTVSAWQAWETKHRVALIPQWLEDVPRGHEGDPLFRQLWPQASAALHSDLADDARNWGGWAARHGGLVEYFGDWVAGPAGRGVPVAQTIFVLLFIGLMGLLARQSWRAVPRALATPPKTAKRAKARRIHA